jgi:hypothetical protein
LFDHPGSRDSFKTQGSGVRDQGLGVRDQPPVSCLLPQTSSLERGEASRLLQPCTLRLVPCARETTDNRPLTTGNSLLSALLAPVSSLVPPPPSDLYPQARRSLSAPSAFPLTPRALCSMLSALCLFLLAPYALRLTRYAPDPWLLAPNLASKKNKLTISYESPRVVDVVKEN